MEMVSEYCLTRCCLGSECREKLSSGRLKKMQKRLENIISEKQEMVWFLKRCVMYDDIVS